MHLTRITLKNAVSETPNLEQMKYIFISYFLPTIYGIMIMIRNGQIIRFKHSLSCGLVAPVVNSQYKRFIQF